jgi:hypothetical protein
MNNLENNSIKYITIGQDCSCRSFLQSIGLFQKSFPFDDKIITEESLIKCFEDDFRDFLNENYFTLANDYITPINKYGISLNHLYPVMEYKNINNINDKDEIERITKLKLNDRNGLYGAVSIDISANKILVDNWLNIHYEKIVPTITRRIERFRETLSNNNYIFLIRRNHISKEGIIKIYDILSARYPNTKIKILFLQILDLTNKEHRVLNYNLDYVVHYWQDINWSSEERISSEIDIKNKISNLELFTSNKNR